MDERTVIQSLAALAQQHRLRLFRLLVEAGPGGLAAGAIAKTLDMPPSSLTFHLNMLREAGLVDQRRDGRSLVYTAAFGAMNALVGYLTENCCEGAECAPSEQGDRP